MRNTCSPWLRLECMENIRPLPATTVVPQKPSCLGMPHHWDRKGGFSVASSETCVLSAPWQRWVHGSEPAGNSALSNAHTPDSSANTFARGRPLVQFQGVQRQAVAERLRAAHQGGPAPRGEHARATRAATPASSPRRGGR